MDNRQRHPLTTRVTHWTIVAAFVVLFGTGAAIYNRRPRIRWAGHWVPLPHVPSWLMIPIAPKPIHYIFAGVFALCGIVYLVWGFRNGYFAFPKYKLQQKGAYYVVLFFLAPLLVASGIPLLPVKFLKPLGLAFVGGAKWWHIGITLALCAFLLGHVGMVVATGFTKNMRAMIGGDDSEVAPSGSA